MQMHYIYLSIVYGNIISLKAKTRN